MNFTDDTIHHHLQTALTQAQQAFDEGNYPIGSILVNEQGEVISIQRNLCATDNDVTAHAEIQNLREIGMNYKQPLTLFTSLEPCYGCSFFIARSSITAIYTALKDPHKGGLSDLQSQEQFQVFFKNIRLINEPLPELANQSRDLMRQYFLKIGKSETAAFYEGKPA